MTRSVFLLPIPSASTKETLNSTETQPEQQGMPLTKCFFFQNDM